MSAIVLLLITIFISWIGGLSFTLLCLALSAVLFYEWQAIVRRTEFDATEAMLTIGFAALLFVSFMGYLAYGLAGFLILGLFLELTSSGEEKADVRWIGLGALYCAIPAIAFPIIRDTGGFNVLMFVFLVVWATDIAAYFVGKKFGGAKLYPSISPKKTWSGAIGGLIGAVIIGLLFQFGVTEFYSPWIWLAAALLSAISQVGDLFESWVKRVFDVKDSSHLIPGHGGFLDRVDGLLAASAPIALLLALNAI